MSDRPTRLVVDCSLPEGHPDKVQIIPLTDEEIAEREAQAIQAAEEQAAREAEAAAKEALKASAKAKLVAGEPLTAEEAEVLVF
jgi:hypothetical protein